MKKKIGRYAIEITHPERILFPNQNIKKINLVEYYEKIGPTMVPYTKDRLLTMHRFPEGIDKKGFYQKDASDYFPDWIKTKTIKKKDKDTVKYVEINNTATLVYLAQQSCITPHIWLSKVDKIDKPDKMIFDLDPPKGNFKLVIEAALFLKDILHDLDLKAFIKTTGSKGLHVMVPIKRSLDFDEVRSFARDIAQILVDEEPNKYTLEIRKDKRKGRLFLDVLRNAYAQTAVAPYGVRALPGAPIAAPLFWDELNDKKLTSQKYNINTIFKRLEQDGDPWDNYVKYARSLKSREKKLDSIIQGDEE